MLVAGVAVRLGSGLGAAGDFSRLRLAIDSFQIDDQMFGSRYAPLSACGRICKPLPLPGSWTPCPSSHPPTLALACTAKACAHAPL